MSGSGRGRLLAVNVGWSLCAQLTAVIVNVAAVPYLIRRFGAEAYGVYLLVYVAGNYLGLFQFGAGLSAIRFVARAKEAGEDRALRQTVLHTGLVAWSGVAAASGLLWLSAGPLARSVFEVPPYYHEEAVRVLRAAALGGFFASGAQWISAVFQGLQRFAWPAVMAAIQAAATPLGLVVLLASGHGLGAAAAWYAFVRLAVLLLGAAALAGALGEHRNGRGSQGFPETARYGLSFWPAALSSVAAAQIDKTFVAGLLGMSDLTYYTVPSGILQRLQGVPAVISHALMPMLSGSQRSGGRAELTRTYLRGARALLAACAPAFILLLALMPQLLALWLGPDFAHRAAPAARMIVAAQLLALASHAPNSLAGGAGGGRCASIAGWAQALAGLALWPLLIPRWGIAGAAAGALAAQALSTIYFLESAHRGLLGLGWGRFLREVGAPLAPALAAMLIAAWLGRALAWGWGGFFSVSAAAGAVYAALLWVFLPQEDRLSARGLLK